MDLNVAGHYRQEQRGLLLVRQDIERWLPVLQFYGLVPLHVVLDGELKSGDKDVVLAGFSRFVSSITATVCHMFAANFALAEANYRTDLVVMHERSRRLATAWSRVILNAEVLVHTLRGHAAVMTPALLILASHAAAGEDIYGESESVPGLPVRESSGTKPAPILNHKSELG